MSVQKSGPQPVAAGDAGRRGGQNGRPRATSGTLAVHRRFLGLRHEGTARML